MSGGNGGGAGGQYNLKGAGTQAINRYTMTAGVTGAFVGNTGGVGGLGGYVIA